MGRGLRNHCLTDKRADIKVTVDIENPGKRRRSCRSRRRYRYRRKSRRNRRSQECALNPDLRVKNPERWDIDNPYLYKLNTELWADGKYIDGNNNSRIASLSNLDKGFALNGRWMKVKEGLAPRCWSAWCHETQRGERRLATPAKE